MQSYAAIAVSGTITLELAVSLVPMIVVYQLNLFSFLILKLMVKVKYISLINIILSLNLVPELIQRDFNRNKFHKNLDHLLNYKKSYNRQISYFKKGRNLLFSNHDKPSSYASKLLRKILLS